MKIFTLIISLFLGNLLFAQSKGELVIFSNLGDHFFLLVNGERQNQQSATNVKVQEMLPGFYSCKVISENNLYALSTNLEVKAGMRVTYRIIEKKGVVKLRYYTEQATGMSNPPSAGQYVIVYGQAPVVQQSETTVIQTTTSQTTNSNNGSQQAGTTSGENVNININMSETGFSTNVLTNGTNVQQNGTSAGTTTTTTTTSTNGGTPIYNPKPITNANCLVDATGMQRVITMIKKESFDDDKMNVAKQFTKTKCLTVSQVKEIAVLFSFSDDKLEYVKYAYDYCMNTSDYYLLSDVFTFSDDKSQFNGFLESK